MLRGRARTGRWPPTVTAVPGRNHTHTLGALVGAIALLAACGSGSTQGRRSPASTSTTPTTASIVNEWRADPVDRTALPIGTTHVSTTGPASGGLYACTGGVTNGPGAFRAGPWIDEAAGTWNAEEKVAVRGAVRWPMAEYAETVKNGTRTIRSTGVPVKQVTGTFPIAADDPAAAYDRNPNRIAPWALTMTVPATPTAAATPTCLSLASVGVARNGVAFYASIDERNRDAVAYETQDVCDGHPQQAGQYHYHAVPSCLLDASKGASTVVGFARDGFPIVVERNAAGELPTNADLDECHGRTSPVLLDGEVVTTYHYSATYEFPYFIGCYRGEPVY